MVVVYNYSSPFLIILQNTVIFIVKIDLRNFINSYKYKYLYYFYKCKSIIYNKMDTETKG